MFVEKLIDMAKEYMNEEFTEEYNEPVVIAKMTFSHVIPKIVSDYAITNLIIRHTDDVFSDFIYDFRHGDGYHAQLILVQPKTIGCEFYAVYSNRIKGS